MKIKEKIEKVTEVLHGAIKGGLLPRPIVFDSLKDLSQALLRAKDAHSQFERGLGAEDRNWPLWYAAYLAVEQGLAKNRRPNSPAPHSKLRPVHKMRHR